jgi:hypothetical protein
VLLVLLRSLLQDLQAMPRLERHATTTSNR